MQVEKKTSGFADPYISPGSQPPLKENSGFFRMMIKPLLEKLRLDFQGIPILDKQRTWGP